MSKETTQAEVVAKSAGRKPAPSVVVMGGHVDHRSRILNELSSKDPDHVYMYQKFGVDPWELKTKNQEVVKDEKGEIVHHKGDPVVRVPKEQFDELQQFDADQSRNAVESVVDINRSTVERSPKKPNRLKERK